MTIDQIEYCRERWHIFCDLKENRFIKARLIPTFIGEEWLVHDWEYDTYRAYQWASFEKRFKLEN